MIHRRRRKEDLESSRAK